MQLLKVKKFLFRSERGVTLMDFLVTLSIFLILTSVGVTHLPEFIESFEKKNAKEQVQGDLTLAKVKAVNEGARAILSISSDGSVYTLGLDYLPLSTDSPPAVDEVVFTRALPRRVSVSVDQTLIYNTRGMVVDESSDLTTTTLTLNYRDTAFMTLTIYPTGSFDID